MASSPIPEALLHRHGVSGCQPGGSWRMMKGLHTDVRKVLGRVHHFFFQDQWITKCNDVADNRAKTAMAGHGLYAVM